MVCYQRLVSFFFFYSYEKMFSNRKTFRSLEKDVLSRVDINIKLQIYVILYIEGGTLMNRFSSFVSSFIVSVVTFFFYDKLPNFIS